MSSSNVLRLWKDALALNGEKIDLGSGETLDLIPGIDDQGAINVGNGTNDMDVKVFLGSTTEYVLADVGNSRVEFACPAIGAGSTNVPFIPLAAQQALSGAGAVNITTFYTAWTTTGADAGTLADGAQVGQLKKVQLIVDGGDGTLTPSNLSGGTTITFADAGDYALLGWDGSNWLALELGNDADGATGPALA